MSLIASRTTGRGPGNWGLHLNASWLSHIAPGPRDRPHGHGFGAALSHVATERLVLVAAFRQETQGRGERDLRMVEAGLDVRLSDAVGWAVAAGAGLTRDSPALRIRTVLTIGF